jgi:endonuclease/exonuclease/phosphatase family metal-dependent hydrolase
MDYLGKTSAKAPGEPRRPKERDLPLKVMSFNIRTAAAPDGDQAWPRRKHLVIERIRAFDPDLLGLQECREDDQAAFVRGELADYEFVGVPRQGEGDSALEMAPLLYRRAAFEEIGRGHFWLSATPQEPGTRSWGAAYPRTATWVKLRPRAGEAGPLVFLNTHVDYAGSAPEASAALLQAWLRKAGNCAAGDCALIVTGDFNADRASPAYRTLTDGGMLADALREAGATSGSFHDFGRAERLEAIDWILASAHFRVVEAGVDTFRRDDLYPSDHFPVAARLLHKRSAP